MKWNKWSDIRPTEQGLYLTFDGIHYETSWYVPEDDDYIDIWGLFTHWPEFPKIEDK